MRRSLSLRLLILTIGFVMLAEVLIFVPSVAQFRLTWLESKLEKAQLASLALEATSDNMISPRLETELLANAMVNAVILKRAETRSLMLSDNMPVEIDAVFDLREANFVDLIRDALATLVRTDNRTINVVGQATLEAGQFIEIIVDEAPLRSDMAAYGLNIFLLSLVISVFTASLLFLVLNAMIVRPMARIAHNIDDFRGNPEDADRIIPDSNRHDEIGTVEHGLHDMQEQIRGALKQKTRLANLGAAVAKISHDLRNILASARLVSDRLAVSADPQVRQMTPTLMRAIDRAVTLCDQTLRYGRAEEPRPRPVEFELPPIIDEIAVSLGLGADGDVRLANDVPSGFMIYADPDSMFRAIQNLARNAVEATVSAGEVRVCARREDGEVIIDVADTGPGLPPKALDNLFQPFTGSARSGGTGLGLVNVREIVEAHHGRVLLVRTDERGTLFRICLPISDVERLTRAAG